MARDLAWAFAGIGLLGTFNGVTAEYNVSYRALSQPPEPNHYYSESYNYLRGVYLYRKAKGDVTRMGLPSAYYAVIDALMEDNTKEEHDSKIPQLVKDVKASHEECDSMFTYFRFFLRLHSSLRTELSEAESQKRRVNASVMGKLKLISDAAGDSPLNIQNGFTALSTMITNREQIECSGPTINKDVTIATYKDMHAELLTMFNEINVLVQRLPPSRV